jgi:PAS domain S-box-containing protein
VGELWRPGEFQHYEVGASSRPFGEGKGKGKGKGKGTAEYGLLRRVDLESAPKASQIFATKAQPTEYWNAKAGGLLFQLCVPLDSTAARYEDVMDRDERFQAALSEEGRYRLLVDAITDYAIYMLDPTGRVISWNAGATRLTGYNEEEILGQHFSRFYTPEDVANGAPERALTTAKNGGRFEAEGWRVRKDGTRFWGNIVIDPIREPDGLILGFAKVTRDLTERRHAESELKHSEEELRLLVQGVTDYAIYMLDPKGIITNWNVGAERIKGYKPHEIIGEHFSRFYTEEDRTKGLPAVSLSTAERDGRFESEGWRVRHDGTWFWANAVIDAVYAPDGTIAGFAKVTRDITERRAAQKELDQAREALFQSQKVEAIGQLTGGVAHDFNNPLMVILGSLELALKRAGGNTQVIALLDNAMQAARRGVGLTKRMLAFARRQDLELQPVDIPDLVRGMTELLQRSLGPSISIETRFALALPKVWADANQIESALLNLIVNARDAMPDGGTIIIAAQPAAIADGEPGPLAPGRYVRLAVADTGEGMDANTLARAAEPFFTTKGVGKGTGLGLSMVHGLVEQLKGRMAISSHKGQGTTVEVWLPAAPAAARTAGMTSEAPEPPAAARPAGPMRILAVDDDALVLMNTASMLEDLGHQVLSAESAAQALEVLHRETVALVITDQAMPGMTGAQLAATIAPEWPGLPVLLVTGYAELPDGVGVGIPILSKPFSLHQLADAIAAIAPAVASEDDG